MIGSDDLSHSTYLVLLSYQAFNQFLSANSLSSYRTPSQANGVSVILSLFNAGLEIHSLYMLPLSSVWRAIVCLKSFPCSARAIN